ncbi:MAG TPA: hypothetical protein VL383_11470 [Gemmatimonadaceae bacterium]|nr:hypothetical protein [Gemmatimonadaceae bacterium]
MRSRRRRLEIGCRIAAFAVLGWLIGTSLMPAAERSLERATSRDIASRLAAWTRLPPAVALHADLSTAPDPYVADWLGALRHAGHAVAWSGSPPAVAIAADALNDPAGGVLIDVAAPSGAEVTVRDAASAIDSVRVAALGATMTASIAVDSIVAESRGQRFSAPVPEPARVRAALVVGQAGWEGKFVARALEERGWTVMARFGVAPRVEVTQGSVASLDTSRFSVVIAIDSTIDLLGAATLERFVRQGGGLVLAGAAGASRAAASLAPGRFGARTRPSALPPDTIGLGATGFYPVRALEPNASVLDQRAGGVSVAARRVGAGRVIQVGYDDSWRWRMAGGPDAEAAHRAWWSRVAGGVAYVPVGRLAAEDGYGAAAPVAHLVERIGPARATVQRAGSRGVDSRILMAIIMILLLTEWGSRRLRGLA